MRNVVLDVDTGADDALALLYALSSPGLRVHGVTCVSGNVGLEAVVRNTCALVGAVGAGVPVAAGAARPLVVPAAHAAHVHGVDGLLGVMPPGVPVQPDPRHAVELLRDVILDAPDPVTLVALAPQTNLALLARTYPEVIGRVAEVAVMGGGVGGGNATAVAEFNVYADPEAAAVVTDAGWPVRMYGLDVFYDPHVPVSGIARLRGAASVGARVAAEVLSRLGDAPAGRAYLGDAGLVVDLDDPGAVRYEAMPVTVDVRPGLTRGMTVADRRGRTQEVAGREPWTAVQVATAVDATRVARRFVDVLCG